MQKSTDFKQPIVVLSCTKLKEADLLLRLLTPDLGKISAVSKSAGSSRKRFMGGIDLFLIATALLKPPKGNSNLFSLNALLQRDDLPRLREDLALFIFASFLVELADAFTAEGDQQAGALFEALRRSLKALTTAEDRPAQACVVSYFLLHVLVLSGYNPLESSLRYSEQTTNWANKMLKAGRPIRPATVESISEFVAISISFAEEILDKPLRTKSDLLLKLTNL